MKKVWEYLGLKPTSMNPYGYRKYMQYGIIGKRKGKYLVEIKHDYTQYRKESWKTLSQLKASIRKLETITPIAEKYLKMKEGKK